MKISTKSGLLLGLAALGLFGMCAGGCNKGENAAYDSKEMQNAQAKYHQQSGTGPSSAPGSVGKKTGQ